MSAKRRETLVLIGGPKCGDVVEIAPRSETVRIITNGRTHTYRRTRMGERHFVCFLHAGARLAREERSYQDEEC